MAALAPPPFIRRRTAAVRFSGAGRRTLLRPGWPFVLMLGAYPLWWILGVGAVIWPILALPMVAWLTLQRRVRVPAGFGLWLLFLLWMLASALQLEGEGRGLVFAWRVALYGSATVLLVYLYNLPARVLTSRRIVDVLALLWIAVLIGGYLGLLFPSFSFTSPFERLVPEELLSNGFVYDLVHPRFAQIQDVLGFDSPRPSAPFVYTNDWGANFGLLSPFFLVGWLQSASGVRRVVGRVLMAAGFVPVVWSLNRGLWLSLCVGLGYAAVRFALRGKTRALHGLLASLAVVAMLVMLTPLREVVSQRFESPHSNDARTALYTEALAGVAQQPLFGYGSPRPFEDRPLLPSVGTQGQLWLVLFSHGYPGLAFYVAWFGVVFWRTRRNTTPAGFWAHVALLVMFVQMPFYGMLPVQLHVVMTACALALRERGTAARAPAEEAVRSQPLPQPV